MLSQVTTKLLLYLWYENIFKKKEEEEHYLYMKMQKLHDVTISSEAASKYHL